MPRMKIWPKESFFPPLPPPLSIVKFHDLFRSDNLTAERSFILRHSVGNISSLPFNQASNHEASTKSVCNVKYWPASKKGAFNKSERKRKETKKKRKEKHLNVKLQESWRWGWLLINVAYSLLTCGLNGMLLVFRCVSPIFCLIENQKFKQTYPR